MMQGGLLLWEIYISRVCLWPTAKGAVVYMMIPSFCSVNSGFSAFVCGNSSGVLFHVPTWPLLGELIFSLFLPLYNDSLLSPRLSWS